MNERLRQYIDALFQEAPDNMRTVEVKEEILQNLTEKYNDLLREGKSEDAAYNIAIASIGDVGGLIHELQGYPAAHTVAMEENAEGKKRSAAVTAIAVMLYILCPVPLFIFQSELGLILLFVFVAVATAMLIFDGIANKSRKEEQETMVEEFQQWRNQTSGRRSVYNAITSVVWVLGLIAYFLISFGTGAWYITWLIFPLIGAVNGIIKAIFDLVS